MSIEKQHTVTIEWLRYAEAKNGAIVALASVLLTGLAPWDKSTIDAFTQAYLWMAFAGTALALLLGLVSFLPFTDRKPFLSSTAAAISKADRIPNWSFFGDIAQNSLASYTQALAQRGERIEDPTISELVDQVHINSRICQFKLSLFRACVHILIGALFTPVVGLLIWAISRQGHDAK